MDLSDVGVRHAVAFTTLNIRHSLEISPSTISVFKELRYCVIVVVIGFTTASIVRSLVDLGRAQPSPTVPPSNLGKGQSGDCTTT